MRDSRAEGARSATGLHDGHPARSPATKGLSPGRPSRSWRDTAWAWRRCSLCCCWSFVSSSASWAPAHDGLRRLCSSAVTRQVPSERPRDYGPIRGERVARSLRSRPVSGSGLLMPRTFCDRHSAGIGGHGCREASGRLAHLGGRGGRLDGPIQSVPQIGPGARLHVLRHRASENAPKGCCPCGLRPPLCLDAAAARRRGAMPVAWPEGPAAGGGAR